MRLFLAVLMVSLSFSFESIAQNATDKSGRTVYNRSLGGYGSSVYNAPSSSYSTRGPLSLRQILEGKEDTRNSSSQNTYYGGSNFRPYGVSNNNYSLALSPDEIRASRARRDALAQRQESESMRAIQQASYDDVGTETEGYLNQFQSNPVRIPVGNTSKTRFKQRKDGFEIPKKVFNSVR